jgi:uncharacterized FAD-dependent dehydrogenase
MISQIELRVSPKEAQNIELLKIKCARKLKLKVPQIKTLKFLRRSIDARNKPKILLKIAVYIDEDYSAEASITTSWNKTNRANKVLIIGAGPAGYFAALECIELGLNPIVFDRGKDVQSRRRDLRAIQQFGQVNPDSNYCFGEGGAGTYSDGKLYTRSKKRGDYIKVLKLLVEHGASPDILIDAHPHIGSNKLPKIIANIRERIENFGGEVHFNTRIEKLLIDDGKIVGIADQDGTEYEGKQVILATGHSARDIYFMLEKAKLKLEFKEFALGVRIEHPQALIDEIQYRQNPRDEYLPPAAYRLACQVRRKGVFSFCMCPGGLIVPSATAPGELVVNGMSLSRRDSAFANSGVVTPVGVGELSRFGKVDIFSGLQFQKRVEQGLFNYGDGSQKAPAQRLSDFINAKLSSDLNECSYIPGIYSAPLHEMLPDFIYQRLKQGILGFNRSMKGYLTGEANVLAPESRTSSPVRIPRGKTNYMHPQLEGLYPCGEGAGYAGGILSAAMDGQNVARAIKFNLQTVK